MLLLLFTASASFVTYSQGQHAGQTPSTSLALPSEKHLRNVRQLTFGGTNAEAYFSADDKYLIFMHSGEGVPCDQMYTMPVDTPDGKPAIPKMVSTGKGRTTCGYFFPSGNRILFSSTHETSAACPPGPDYSKGYVWPIYSSYAIYTAKPDGSDLKRLTNSPGYNAESTISRDGKKIVFTSMRNGDLDVYSMNADGSDVRQLTHELGYDGGAWFSDDGKKIVYRSEQPKTPEADRRLQGPAFPWLDPSRQSRDLGHGCRRQPQAPGHAQRRRELRPVFSSRRQTHHFCFKYGQPEGPQRLRSLPDQRRRHGPRTSHLPTPISTPSRCFPPTASASSGLPTATEKLPHETNLFIADWVE